MLVKGIIIIIQTYKHWLRMRVSLYLLEVLLIHVHDSAYQAQELHLMGIQRQSSQTQKLTQF
jgi:hypothetical protein